jgi:O-antigen ligase
MSYQKKNLLDNILIILFSIYPLAILAGNFIINSFITIIALIFIFRFFKKETHFFQYKYDLYLLSFFLISLAINLFFTNNFYLSYQRVLKIFFVIFFVIAFRFLIINFYQNLRFIYKMWCIIFLIVIFDLIFEFFVGKNIFGQSSVMSGRLGSFTGDESVVGHYFFGFCLIFLSYLYNQTNKISLNVLFAILFIIISFLIGERANFIKTFTAITIFIFFVYKINYKYKFLSIFLLLISSYVAYLNVSSDYKARYFDQIKPILSCQYNTSYTTNCANGLTNYLSQSKYGAHRNVAKEIFLDNYFFGVGIKNFRIESANKKYDGLDHKKNHLRVSNHPHDLYYEILSETGIFGLFCFIIFIFSSIFLSLKNYLQTKNMYQLSGIIIVCLSVLPIIPTGSFLATYSSSIFWINYAIMMGYNVMRDTKF